MLKHALLTGALALALTAPTFAQQSKTQLTTQLNSTVYTNGQGAITAAALNSYLLNSLNSTVLLSFPTVNVGNVCGYPVANQACVGGSTAAGSLLAGHLGVGSQVAGVNAFVTEQLDESYLNPNQEMRGVSSVVRHSFDASHPDEPTLGWDSFALIGATVVSGDNAQNIVGNMKGVVGELYFERSSTNYSIKNAYNFQANLVDLASGVTLTTWQGLTVNGTPSGNTGGTITNGFDALFLPMTATNAYGLVIQPLTGTAISYGLEIQGVTAPSAAAIRLDGTLSSGTIQWNHASITENGTSQMVINAGSGLLMSGLLSAGTGGGLFLCVDTAGNVYKKATCP